MKVTITKRAQRNELSCWREDGSRASADLGPSLPHHDLAHFGTVSSIAGIGGLLLAALGDGFRRSFGASAIGLLTPIGPATVLALVLISVIASTNKVLLHVTAIVVAMTCVVSHTAQLGLSSTRDRCEASVPSGASGVRNRRLSCDQIRHSIFMRNLLYLLLVISFQCAGCDAESLQTLRGEVERAFSQRSFASFAENHRSSERVEVLLEDEYNEDEPTRSLYFKNSAELAKWFDERHAFMAQMIVPEPVRCSRTGCRYTRPELTLHHGAYLVSFEIHKHATCSISKLRIYWG